MNLEELLASETQTTKSDLSEEDFAKLLRKYKGLLKERGRDKAFWEATNENLKIAYGKLDEKERELARAYAIIQEDLTVGSQVQQALQPKATGKMAAELDIAVYHKQLAEVGGDYYDFFRTKNGDYAIGVFDISGHGVSAALVMTYLKALFTQIMETHVNPEKIVEEVNRSCFGFLRKVKKYATVNFVVFGPNSVTYTCAGGFGMLLRHREPTLFQKRDNFLGLREKPFHQHTLPFEKGDFLVLYTDGIVEAKNAHNEDYTVSRLNRLVSSAAERGVAEVVRICLGDYQDFREKDTDDITFIALQKKA
jgi:sigma-B regulation protein RsbU (phosphoserine phosphatase)